MTSEKDKTKKPGKILCGSCKKTCKGSVLKVQEKYFHLDCFKCHKCKCSLAKGGFFCKDNRYYCSADYQILYGTKCAVCKQFVQGEVVTALGKTYHQKCFACSRCNRTFVYGQKVIYTKNQCVCAECMEAERLTTKSIDKDILAKEKKIKKDKNNNTKSASLPLLDKKPGTKKSSKEKEIKNNSKNDQNFDKLGKDNCAGCKRSLSKPTPILHQSRPASRQKNVQIQDCPVTEPKDHATLYALNRHWHETCFRCSTCETPLFNKEYMTSKLDPEAAQNDSQNKLVDSPEHQMTAHCMTCYKAKLSVRCSYCSRIIEGKVLQAGDDLHFHPTCCRCFKCGFLFTNAQEMYVQGRAIWHAHCENLRYEQLENSHLSPFTRSRSLPRSQPISPFGSLYQVPTSSQSAPGGLSGLGLTSGPGNNFQPFTQEDDEEDVDMTMQQSRMQKQQSVISTKSVYQQQYFMETANPKLRVLVEKSVWDRHGDLTVFGCSFRIGIVLVTIVMAVTIPHFSILMGFIGNFTGTMLSFIWPCYFHLKLHGDSLQLQYIVTDCFIIFLGVSFAIIGIYDSGAAMVEAFQIGLPF